MKQIKKLVRLCEYNSYELSEKMIELEVVKKSVEKLLGRIDSIVENKWHEQLGMANLSIKEIHETVRLINMAFNPLFQQMNSRLHKLNNDSTQLYDTVHGNEGDN